MIKNWLIKKLGGYTKVELEFERARTNYFKAKDKAMRIKNHILKELNAGYVEKIRCMSDWMTTPRYMIKQKMKSCFVRQIVASEVLIMSRYREVKYIKKDLIRQLVEFLDNEGLVKFETRDGKDGTYLYDASIEVLKPTRQRVDKQLKL